MRVPSEARSGLLEGSARVLREVLRTPRVRATLGVLRSELDPEHAPLVVGALMEDQASFLDGLATTPKVANAVIAGAGELAARLGQMPPEMLRAVARRLAAEVDTEGAGVAAGAALALSSSLAFDGDGPRPAAERFVAGLRSGLQSAGADPGEVAERAARWIVRGTTEVASVFVAGDAEEGSPPSRAVAALAEEIRRAGRNHPHLVAQVVRPIVAALRDLSEVEDQQDEVGHAE